MEIKSDSLLSAWKNALQAIYQQGNEFNDQDGRVCRELLNLVITIDDPEKTVMRPIEWLRAQESWIYPSLDQIAKIVFSKHRSLLYTYEYGDRAFHFNGKKNQIRDFITPLLLQNPESRRALVCFYDPLTDSDLSNSAAPSLILAQFRVVSRKLHVTGYLRSNDLFIGWPANVYQLFLLQKWVAEKLQTPTGTLTTLSGSAHLFMEYEEEMKRLLNDVV